MKCSTMNTFRILKLKAMFCSVLNSNKILPAVTAFILILSFEKSVAQNINRPNKMGPMGTEVNTNTGNMFLSRSDIYIPARKLDFDISFNYNSFSYADNTGYGNGWSFMYDMRYKIDTAGSIGIIWSNGREDMYKINGNKYIPPVGFFDSLSQYQSGKYLLRTKDGLQYYFDNGTHKRVTKMQEPNGNFLNFSYTDSLLTSITNAAGQSITLSYTNGKLTSVTDANATPVQTYTYTYDGYGNLAKVTDPMGGQMKYSYLVNGPMQTMTDKNNNVADIIYYSDFTAKELITCNSRTAFSYDSATRTTSVIDFVPTAQNQVSTYKFNEKGWLTNLIGSCCGYNMTFVYDNSGNLIQRKDANGNIYKYTYDNRGNYLTITDPLSNIITYTYSSDFNNITGITDPLGNSYTINFNAAGNPTRTIKPGNLQSAFTYNANGDLISQTDENNNTTSFLYDAYGYPQKITLPLSTELLSKFDARGNLLSEKDPNGNIYSYQYDSLNQIKTIIDPLNHSQNFTYDKEGILTSYTDAKGFKQILSYDASNRIVSYKDAKGIAQSYSYDAMDNLILHKDELGKTITFNYDNQNRLSTLIDQAGNGFSFNYDASGNMVSILYPNGNTMNYTYDALNRITGGGDDIGSLGNLTYNKNGRITSFTNATGASVLFAYDNLNRLTKVTDPLGNSRVFTYDNNDNLLTKKDRNNNISSYTYNALDRLTSFTDNNNNHINVQYDSIGNVTKLSDQNGNITLYQYDVLSRPVKMIYPDGSNIVLTYDNNNNVTSAKLADGSTLNYSHDSTNLLISKILPNGEQHLFTYDAKRRLIAAGNAAGTVTFAYDDIDRLTSEVFNSHTTTYNYNTLARTMTTTYPNGSVVTKSFDKRLRLNSLSANNQQIAGYQYNNIDQLTQKNYANGVITNYQYDNANRLTSVLSNKGNLPSMSFQYDNEMNKTVVARSNDPQYSETFSYDANYRLINYKQGTLSGNNIPNPVIQNTYTYDAVGNRVTANLNGLGTTYNINNLNQYTHLANPSQNINFTYDGNGNQTYDGNFYMRYDAIGRKIVDSIAGNIYRYQYDALGRRIVKSVNGVPTNYYYAGLQQIEERDGSDNVLAKQIFSNAFMPLVRNTNNRNYFYHQNDLNSTEAITDSTGNLIEKYKYEDFGKTSFYDGQNNPIASSTINNRFLFTGQEYDNHNSSYNFYFRNYKPETGSFSQRDPIGYTDQMGMYQYVDNNPSTFIDPLGLVPCPPGGTQSKLDPYSEERVANLSKVGNYLSVITQLLKELQKKQRAYRVNLSKDARFDKLNKAVNIVNLIAKSENLRQNYQNMAEKDVNVEVAEIELAVIGLANDFGATKPFGIAGKGFSKAISTVSAIDAFSQEATGHSLSYHYAHLSDASEKLGSLAARRNEERFQRLEKYIDAAYKTQGNDVTKWTKEAKENYDIYTRVVKFREENVIQKSPDDCPPAGDNGTQNPKPKPNDDGQHAKTEVVVVHDPNEMIGPDGVGNNKWVSIKDRLPYTVLFENDISATASVKVVKVIYPIDPNQDASTFQLGSFGFNNLTFSVPANTNAYYQRLDARDSLGLYVDITAGIDAVKKQAFWIFESIDPVTQQITNDPLKGFLLRQDSTKPTSGNGFVNFSIKPVTTAHTRDTISAIASIVFDSNDTIPTNRAKNTIDALPPISHLNSNYQAINANTVKLSWSGNDDAGGSGIANYSLYVSTNNKPYTLYRSNINDTTILFSGVKDTIYCFFIAAKDSVKNEEVLSNNCALTVSVTGGPLYVSNITDFFRSKQSGNWNDVNTWESSPDNVTYNSSTLSPDSSAKTITIRNGHTVIVTVNVTTDQTIVNPLGALVVTGSTLNVTNNGLTLKSDATGTARIGNSTGTITGNVIAERYIPANGNRAWRLLSVPTITAQTINAAWQNGQAKAVMGIAGIGTMITSNNGNASFDFQTPGNSMLGYNATANAWNGITNTTANIATDNGYMLFIRGDRTATPLNSLIASTTLSTMGGLKQGNYPASPMSVEANKFGLIGNPYASQIDFTKVTKGAGIDSTFYVWDPKLTGSYGLGAYQTLTSHNGNYIITPGGGSYGNTGSVMNTIESGQAFFVHATSPDNISFTENAKSNGSNMVFRTVTDVPKSLITNLYSVETGGDNLADGTMILTDNNYSNAVDNKDALKLTNFGLNLGIMNNGNILTVEKRKSFAESDTVLFNLTNAKQQQYHFEFIANGLQQAGLSALLVDKYLNTNTPVDLNGTTSVNFTVTKDSASSTAGRFMIVFAKPKVEIVGNSSIVFYPNPTNTGSITLQLNNMPKGKYLVRVTNALGQTAVSKQFEHAGGSSSQQVDINKMKGTYILEITKPDNSKFSGKVIVN